MRIGTRRKIKPKQFLFIHFSASRVEKVPKMASKTLFLPAIFALLISGCIMGGWSVHPEALTYRGYYGKQAQISPASNIEFRAYSEKIWLSENTTKRITLKFAATNLSGYSNGLCDSLAIVDGLGRSYKVTNPTPPLAYNSTAWEVKCEFAPMPETSNMAAVKLVGGSPYGGAEDRVLFDFTQAP
jgi:hypothetical protein